MTGMAVTSNTDDIDSCRIGRIGDSCDVWRIEDNRDIGRVVEKSAIKKVIVDHTLQEGPQEMGNHLVDEVDNDPKRVRRCRVRWLRLVVSIRKLHRWFACRYKQAG